MTQPVTPVVFQPKRYRRRPFSVEAVQLTIDNVETVATWCNGIVRTGVNPANKPAGPGPYIKIDHIKRALNDRQTRAYPGDWVLKAGGGFKIYTPLAFNESFEPEEVERMFDVVDRMIEREKAEDDAENDQMDSTTEDSLPAAGRSSFITPGY